MKRIAMLLGTIASVVVVGCGKPEPPPSPPPPPAPTLAPIASAPAPAASPVAMPAAVPKCGRTVVQGSCPTSRKCEIKVTVEGSIPVVDPETANVSGSGKLRIIWHLPVGYEFDRDQGDGVQFYVPKTQFQQDYATDDAGGADQGKRKGRHFHWRFENTEKAKYGYAVQFRKGSTVYKCDPTINNEGG